MKTLVAHDRLLSLLAYDSETGHFTWRVKASSRAMPGQTAGYLSRGYRRIRIDGIKYPAHRLAWFYVTAKWPPNEIDHINGDPSDNRLANLRPATHAQNLKNTKLRSSNTSSYKGVWWHKGGQKWAAEIKTNGKKICLGLFSDPAEASEAYRRAAERLHGEFARVE